MKIITLDHKLEVIPEKQMESFLKEYRKLRDINSKLTSDFRFKKKNKRYDPFEITKTEEAELNIWKNYYDQLIIFDNKSINVDAKEGLDYLNLFGEDYKEKFLITDVNNPLTIINDQWLKLNDGQIKLNKARNNLKNLLEKKVLGIYNPEITKYTDHITYQGIAFNRIKN